MNDPILSLLIDVAEEFAEKEGDPPYRREITLTVGGLLICGVICSAKEFLMSDALALRRLAQSASEPEINPTGEEAPDNSVYDSSGFIHLSGVEFFVPGGVNKTPVDGTVPYWRGRLSAIDGFFLGKLAPVRESE